MAVILTILLLISSSAHVHVCYAQTFCSRAVASRSCPEPPTIDNLNLEAYLGRWYEIGSTARFKLLTETGLTCNQALYSSSAGKLSLLNSGLQVINGTAQIRSLDVAAIGVCSSAREACYQIEAAGKVSRALRSINTRESKKLANELTSSAEAAAGELQRVAEDVAHIQEVNGLISQANEYSALQARIADIEVSVKEARREEAKVSGLVARLSKVSGQVWALAGSSVKAKRELAEALTSIAAKLKATTSSMTLSLTALRTGARSLLTTANPIKHPHVTFVTGTITQPNATSAGKLQVSITGTTAPYWIIGLKSDSKGAYSAAMVYSCLEDVAGVIAKSLFVLSREPQLDHATLASFLAKAEALGIYNDCDDPFLLTSQRGATCGKAPSQ